MNFSLRKKNNDMDKLFLKEYSFPFLLLIIHLIFSSFRPDRLLPGGDILLYFPTIILVLLFFLWLNSNNKVSNNIQTKLYLAFIILIIIQFPFARNKSLILHYLPRILLLGLTSYLVKVQFLDTPFKVAKYIKLYLTFSLFIAIMGIIGKGRVSLPILGDENDFCLLMNTLIPFGYFLGQGTSNKKEKIFFYSAVSVFVIANVSSFSRGGFVGLIAVFLYLFFQAKRKFAFLFFLLLIVSLMIYYAPTTYWDEMGTIISEGADEGTGKTRIDNWKAGWKMFLDHPVIGVGPFHYGRWLSDYHPLKSRAWGRVAHSLYITLLAEMGIAGTFLFSWLLWQNYRDHRYISSLEKRKNDLLINLDLDQKEKAEISEWIRVLHFLSLAYGGAMIAYLATGMFISVLWYGYFWIFTSYWVVSANVARKIENGLLEKKSIRL